MTEKCNIPLCPALAAPDTDVCAPHRESARADELGVVGRTCTHCRLKFTKADFVERQRGADTFGRAHVRCEPKTRKPTREEIRASVKPLLEKIP